MFQSNSDYIKVTILGTETREKLFQTYTVYIVKINSEQDTITIYPRFSDLFKVQELVSKSELELDLPVLEKYGPFNTLSSKTIERRKLLIQ